MRSYVIKRVLGVIPLLIGISFLSFILVNLIPSDPAEVALRVRKTPVITEQIIAEIQTEMGLDKPFLQRYLHWLGRVVRLDFGVSYTNPTLSVAGEIARSLPATVQLGVFSFLLTLVLSMPLGFFCAVFKDSWFDRGIRYFVFTASAMPLYWVGLLLMWFFSVYLDLLPTSGRGGISHLILPAATITLTHISTYIRLIRSSMIENLSRDYILYANARGLRKPVVLVHHAFRNSLHSCITAFGMSIPQLLSGTFIVENIFAWPGIGRLCVTAIFNRDYPVIQAYILLTAVFFVFSNLVTDIIQSLSDPAVRKESL